MSTETIVSEKFQQALEAYKKSRHPWVVTVETNAKGEVIIWESHFWRQGKLRSVFSTPERAIPFLLGQRSTFYVQRITQWEQIDTVAVQAINEDDATTIAERTEHQLPWEMGTPMQYLMTEMRAHTEDQQNRPGICAEPPSKPIDPDKFLLIQYYGAGEWASRNEEYGRERRRTIAIDINDIAVLNPEVVDDMGMWQGTDQPMQPTYVAPSDDDAPQTLTVLPRPVTAVSLPATRHEAGAVFHELDMLLSQVERGSESAKGVLSATAQILRLKMALVKFMQSQDDRAGR